MKKDLIRYISELETIEEKSFWVVAPLIALLGLVGLTTAGAYGSAVPVLVSAILCLIFPVILMMSVYRHRNYHVAYPLLCICIGAISVPFTFVFAGGFLSGMPLFCVVSTCVTAMCYSKRWRITALLLCFLGNSVAFYYVYNNNSPYPLGSTYAIYDDVIFAYFFASFSAFIAINLSITEVRKYSVKQNALQQYFDVSVRNEILNKAVKGDISQVMGHNKAVILFVDISNFTSITEKMSSDLIAEFLNEFFLMAGNCIHDTHGIIDKYIGDCVMAYWFEQSDENCVLSAIQAVLNMRKELKEKSDYFYERFETELGFTAGIAYGDVIFGDFGSEMVHNYTLIGDAVNTASRIEGYAVSDELLISDSAAAEVRDMVEMELVEKEIYFKGKNNAVNLYRVLGFIEDKQKQEVEHPVTNGYELHILGCRGSFPVSGTRFFEYGGETSCYILKKNDYAVIIDCGTGLKNASKIVSGCKRVDILLTHVHYDHILGLLMVKIPKDIKVNIYGNFNDYPEATETLKHFMKPPYWPIGMTEVENIAVKIGERFSLFEDVSATFYYADHPDDACVIQLVCGDKKICFFADCEDPNKLDPEIFVDSDILFYDGMFDANDSVDHTGWGHGTWQNGVEFAKQQNIKKIVITHHSPEISDHTLHGYEIEARQKVRNISFAKAGDCLIL